MGGLRWGYDLTKMEYGINIVDYGLYILDCDFIALEGTLDFRLATLGSESTRPGCGPLMKWVMDPLAWVESEVWVVSERVGYEAMNGVCAK